MTEVATVRHFSIQNMDAVEWLRSLPSASVDLMITDPAYESLEKHRKVGTTTRLKNSKASSNKWFDIFHNARFPELFEEVYRVLKKNAHLYVMCDAETMFAIKPMGEEAGFKFWKPVIWDKVAIGMGYHYRARCERILFFEKGKRKLQDLGMPDVLAVMRVNDAATTEKPVELLEMLVLQSSSTGQVVADCFSGSAATGVAAIKNGRHFIGTDTCEEAVDIGTERLRHDA